MWHCETALERGAFYYVPCEGSEWPCIQVDYDKVPGIFGDPGGYPRVRGPRYHWLKEAKTFRLSRYIYKLFYDEDIDLSPGSGTDQAIDHFVCHNPPCVQPRHLRLGTHWENMQTMILAGRHSSKLNPEKVREMRRDHAKRMTYPQLSEKYGVHESTVCRIVTRRAWKHVED